LPSALSWLRLALYLKGKHLLVKGFIKGSWRMVLKEKK